MSEETTTAAGARPVRTGTLIANGREHETFIVDFGKNRTVEVRRLTMGDQFDLAELIPDGVGRLWQNMAMLAASVVNIDGKPVLASGNKREMRRVLDSLGDEGVAAANAALDFANPTPPADPEAAQKAQAGNLPETPASGP